MMTPHVALDLPGPLPGNVMSVLVVLALAVLIYEVRRWVAGNSDDGEAEAEPSPAAELPPHRHREEQSLLASNSAARPLHRSVAPQHEPAAPQPLPRVTVLRRSATAEAEPQVAVRYTVADTGPAPAAPRPAASAPHLGPVQRAPIRRAEASWPATLALALGGVVAAWALSSLLARPVRDASDHAARDARARRKLSGPWR